MHIAAINRYPVKSMRGEALDAAQIRPSGLAGDRQWAVVDAKTGVSLSAKRYAILLQCQAWTQDDAVFIRLPDGGEYPAGSAELARRLSELVGREVTIRSIDEARDIRHEFPSGITDGGGEPFLYESSAGSFADSAPLHLLTTGALAALQALLPDADIPCERFRPNIVVETGETGFVETGWVGTQLRLGQLRCEVYEASRRCVMVTRAQPGLGDDPRIIRTILEKNGGTAGVGLKPSNAAKLRTGDTVELLTA